ncbi:hypothetical protein Celaphus_00019431 [Cervus elaphus hippelaphus]|uniref:CTAGE5 n=1 Tax=Cervus elaphus hippelaphus TaxID=46360 RepID=A0A212C3J5_CEREH|nr:hypothetical protein Celaphus_00019431 [Cervus elaphus hippelaphus]
MESLLPASGSTFRLILEHLQGVLLVVSESLTNVPGPPAFLWEILVCAVMIVVIVKRRHTLKSAKLLGQKSSAHDEVCGPCSEDENAGPMAQAEEALRSPGLEASPPRLQTLCQSAMSAMRSKSSFWGNDDFLKMAQESQPPRFSQVTDGKPISKASRKSGAQPQKKMDDSKKTTCFPEGSVLLAQEIARWQMRVQQMKEKERLEQSKSQTEQVLNGKITPLLELLGHYMDDGNPKVPRKKEAEYGPPSIRRSEADLKGVIGDADFSGSLWSPKEIAQPLWEERQSNEELSGQISSLEAEEASLRGENSQLEREIRRLRLKLQVLPQTFEDHIAQLQKRCLEEELRCLDTEKKLGSVCKAAKSLSEDRDLYKRMAEDLGKELMRTNCYHQEQICVHEKRAQALGMAAVSTQSRLKELRRESDRTRQTLAKLHCGFQPFPRGPHAPAAWPAAHRGPKGSGHPSGPQAPQGAGRSRGEGSGV